MAEFESPKSEPQGNVNEMLTIVRRMRSEGHARLDDATVLAIAEVTGTSSEVVRNTIAQEAELEKASITERIRAILLSLDPAVRKNVTAGWLALVFATLMGIQSIFGDRTSLIGILSIIVFLLMAASIGTTTNRKIAMTAGAIFGAASVLGYALVLALFGAMQVLKVPPGPEPKMFLVSMVFGAFAALAVQSVWQTMSVKLGLATSQDERRALLGQLIEIQEKLREHEREMAFLSLDIVGSTKMKENADALSVEFTFSEYHRFVEALVVKSGGRVHSTAGDGVTCAFEDSRTAFRVARQIQSGLFEFNSARNRLGVPIQLRAGIHYGSIVPEGPEVTNVNFSNVIDIAAHLQKCCPVGGVALSLEARENLGAEGETLTETVCTESGVDGWVWRPRASISEVGVSAGTVPAHP